MIIYNPEHYRSARERYRDVSSNTWLCPPDLETQRLIAEAIALPDDNPRLMEITDRLVEIIHNSYDAWRRYS